MPYPIEYETKEEAMPTPFYPEARYSEGRKAFWLTTNPVTADEWEAAEKKFAANPDLIKISRTKTTTPEEKSDEVCFKHSFIKINNEIYAFIGKLSGGSYGIAKLVKNKKDEFFILKIGRPLKEKQKYLQDSEKEKIPGFAYQFKLAEEEQKKTEAIDKDKKLLLGTITREIEKDKDKGSESEKKHYMLFAYAGKPIERHPTLLFPKEKFKIALAVAELHQAGHTHRDLHPGNILLDASGNIHLIDFGFADGEARGCKFYRAPKASADGYEDDLFAVTKIIGYPSVEQFYYGDKKDRTAWDKIEKENTTYLHYTAETLAATLLLDLLINIYKKDDKIFSVSLEHIKKSLSPLENSKEPTEADQEKIKKSQKILSIYKKHKNNYHMIRKEIDKTIFGGRFEKATIIHFPLATLNEYAEKHFEEGSEKRNAVTDLNTIFYDYVVLGKVFNKDNDQSKGKINNIQSKLIAKRVTPEIFAVTASIITAMTGIGLLIGITQYCYTNGNSFLFFNKQTRSSRMSKKMFVDIRKILLPEEDSAKISQIKK